MLRMRRRLFAIGVLVACCSVFLFRTMTARNNPITWDEPVYLEASKAYVNWAKDTVESFTKGDFATPFSRSETQKYWERHSPHPPLAKIINGITFWVFKGVFGRLAALRAGSALFYA